jgi:hypothetical protein
MVRSKCVGFSKKNNFVFVISRTGLLGRLSRRRAEETYARQMLKVCTRFPDVLDCGFEDYLRQLAVVGSRVLAFESPVDEGDENEGESTGSAAPGSAKPRTVRDRYMVPIADLANHARCAPNGWFKDSDSADFELVTAACVEGSAELFLNYASYLDDAAASWSTYGFIDPQVVDAVASAGGSSGPPAAATAVLSPHSSLSVPLFFGEDEDGCADDRVRLFSLSGMRTTVMISARSTSAYLQGAHIATMSCAEAAALLTRIDAAASDGEDASDLRLFDEAKPWRSLINATQVLVAMEAATKTLEQRYMKKKSPIPIPTSCIFFFFYESIFLTWPLRIYWRNAG